MSSRRKIPATIITGFLGAGKTTLVRHLLDHAKGRRIALIINEFGEMGVDGDLLTSCGIIGCPPEDIIELANGCLCCTVADEFLPTIEALLARDPPPDHIVIETSGLALPKPLVKAFQWPDVRSKITVDGVITLVDCLALDAGRFDDTPQTIANHDNPLDEVFSDQLNCADMVLLNKSDLVDEATLSSLLADLKTRVRAGVKVLPTCQGIIDPVILLGLSASAEDDLDQRPSCHDLEEAHDHNDFESFSVLLPLIADPQVWQDKALEVIRSHDIFRIKGFLAIQGKATRQIVQAVGTRMDRYFDRPWKEGETPTSKVVVIGHAGLDRAAIHAALCTF
jgi:cobalamin biosynthesis protein CobW